MSVHSYTMILSCIVTVAGLTGCGPWAVDLSGSVEVLNQSASPIVKNGSAYEKAVLDISAYKTVIIPDNALVEYSDDMELKIFLEKQLVFYGHPPLGMHIANARNYMGCATKSDGKMLSIGTYGEWDSMIEGGAAINLQLVIPRTLEIKRQSNLSGPESIAHDRRKRGVIEDIRLISCYWYGPMSPKEGWTKVRTAADSKKTAKTRDRKE